MTEGRHSPVRFIADARHYGVPGRFTPEELELLVGLTEAGEDSTIACAWLTMRRTNPELTLADLDRLRITVL